MYLARKGTQEGFDQYLATMIADAKSKALEEVGKTMVKESPVDFTLKKLNGELVSLQSLKGKVVVLDFWATWCGPCIASFPVMQRAEKKFSADTNVVFLFVNTSEFSTDEVRLKAVRELAVAKKLETAVLLDEKKADKTFVASKDYKIQGLPTKIILDGNGNIRFRAIGFDGDEEGVEREITAMIELAKKG